MCLNRPDGPLFAGAAALSVTALRLAGGRSRPFATGLLLLLLPVALSTAQLVFRLVYYGEWVPTPRW